MHGYFVASKLYEQARLIANPYVWEEERMKRVKDKVEKERSSRIRGSKKVKVNQRLVDKILKKQENRAEVDTKAGLLGDERFSKLFEDEEFAVDETSREFQVLNPSTVVEQPSDPKASTRYQADSADESSEDDEVRKPSKSKSADDVVMRVSSTQNQGGRVRDTALGSRQATNRRADKSQTGQVVGERQITFVPESKKKKRVEEEAQPTERKNYKDRRSASSNTFRKM
jgi:ribosome biogenesis protein ENP2